MSGAPGLPSPFAYRPGCPLCSIVATPYPRDGSDISALDAAASSNVDGGGAGASASSSSATPTVGFRTYSPLRRDSGSPVSSNSSNNTTRNSGIGYGGVPINATTHSSTTNVIVYKDPNITAYIEKKFPVSSKGHIIIVLKSVSCYLRVVVLDCRWTNVPFDFPL
jgi:hypothetical protein